MLTEHIDCVQCLCLFTFLSFHSYVIFCSFLFPLINQVGNEERIHVYYAHGQDNPGFVRRCYWLLDKYVYQCLA